MAIIFPTNPTNGQVHAGYYYDSDKGAWRSLPLEQAQSVSSATPPLTANPGEFWFNTNDGVLFTYFDDGTSSQWVEVKANSSLGSTLAARTDTLESTMLTKANLSGGNTFTGVQTFSGLTSSQASPAFRAYRTSNITGFNASTQVNPVVFNATSYNIGNHYNTSTGLFTAPIAGRYVFFAGIYSSVNPEQIWPILNGVRQQSFLVLPGVANIAGCAVFYLNANDTFGVTPWASGNSSFTINSDIYHTYLHGAYIG